MTVDAGGAGSGAVVDTIDVQAVNSKQNRKLFAARVKIFPKRASGTFRRLKWWIMAVTLGIYYLTPWIRWDRGPYASDQAVLVDLANHRFFFFFIEIWPQEFYYVAGLLIMAGIGLFLVTSTVGRAWCGYTCPQTVWVDLFLVVERWVEGDRNQRIKLDKANWSFDKVRKLVVKHAIWLLIAMATGGAWVFYFADAPVLLVDLVHGRAPFVAYATFGVLTATTYLFAGFMREQVCTYMCPWPRIQAAMLDEDSLTVTYNDWRGEPRGKLSKASVSQAAAPAAAPAPAVRGDCIDCNQCVAVCPMGIDIRDGQQLECITCALCIDACDAVMAKIDRPLGLIGYSTLRELDGRAAGAQITTTWRSFVRPRTMVYFALWSLAGLVMLAHLGLRDRLDVSVLHDRNPLFVRLSDGSIRNGYTVKVLNMETRPRVFSVSLDGLNQALLHMDLAAHENTIESSALFDVEPDKLRLVRIYVHQPAAAAAQPQQDFRFIVRDAEGGEQSSAAAVFYGPGKPE